MFLRLYVFHIFLKSSSFLGNIMQEVGYSIIMWKSSHNIIFIHHDNILATDIIAILFLGK